MVVADSFVIKGRGRIVTGRYEGDHTPAFGNVFIVKETGDVSMLRGVEGSRDNWGKFRREVGLLIRDDIAVDKGMTLVMCLLRRSSQPCDANAFGVRKVWRAY